ncbi:hypothetical protein FSP39_018052 [Pinctada imbricata]|uniref:Uncharacterized protein n=1 Tax=Pinctada imbricata TaxID=66713 RepID=A0AA88Y9X0_PINIB|nr:hypothetical protein FSP39_018052 [Pinctada imbricata]
MYYTCLNFSEIFFRTRKLHRYGESILQCSVRITKGIKECGNDVVLKYVCALLNSGGGILHMKSLDYNHGVKSKDLDLWWSGMENKFADIISGDDICNYFDMVGNFDDPDLYLFVKSAEHICTIDYHARLPTDTATHEVSYHSVIKLLRKEGRCCSLADLPPIPEHFFYGKTCEQMKQETKQIQFKQLSTPNNPDSLMLPDRMSHMVSKYVSAFANHEGGHIFFGIEDDRAAVYGEQLNPLDQQRAVALVQNRMNIVIWGDARFKAIKGVHWDINFYPVENCPKKKQKHRVVVVVSVCKFPGGVFTACPDSYFINEEGNVQSWVFHQWKLSMLNSFRDKPELHNRFVRLPISVPQAPLVFTLKHTIQGIKAKLLRENVVNKPQPQHFLETYASMDDRRFIYEILGEFNTGKHLCIFVNCWGLAIALQRPEEVICDVLILSESHGCHLLTFAKSDEPHVHQHSQSVAASIKFKFVSLGGCTDKFGIVCHLICMYSHNHEEFKQSLTEYFYPSHFYVTLSKLDNLIEAMVISISAYTPVDFTTLANNRREAILSSDVYFFLLTCDQFELLWTQQFTRELWVHSPPGGGKTVAAVQFIQELKRRGCNKENILYLAENEMLCSYVRSFEICKVLDRRKFLEQIQECDRENAVLFQNVQNVVVDDAQNFKDRDGDWYGEIQKMLDRNTNGNKRLRSVREGYFWVFMDYAQKVHKFSAGLPSVIGKNNFMMSEVTRNSKEIFDYALQFMQPSETNAVHVGETRQENKNEEILRKVESDPKLGHTYKTGRNVDIVKCNNSQIKMKLFEKLSQLLDSGVDVNDLAILVSKTKEKKDLETDVIRFEKEKGVGCHMTVETVKQFSGLEKPAIIGVNPHVNENHADLDKFVVNLATRAKESLVIISPDES